MKNQKGMGHLMLIICIAIILLIIVGIVIFLKDNIEKEKLETYETDMLLLQGKVKIISQESTIQKNEELLKGRKLEDCLEEEQIKNLLEKGIISKEDENISKYYILEKENLEEMELTNIIRKDGFYIVNYQTEEIIYSKGIKLGREVFYKLSELEELKSKEEMEQIEQEQEQQGLEEQKEEQAN